MLGTVYKSTGTWYTVKTDDGDFFECRINGKFRIKGIKSTNPLCAISALTISVSISQFIYKFKNFMTI